MNQARSRIRVAVLSDNPFTVSAINGGLRAHRDLQVVGCGDTLDVLVANVRQNPIDILVMDTIFGDSEQGMRVIRLLREIREKLPRIQIVSLLESDRSVHITTLLRMFVSGVVIKSAHCIHDIVLAVRYVRRGSLYLCNLAHQYLNITPFWADLTEKEIEVALCLHHSKQDMSHSRQTLAAQLGIGEGTLKTHLANLRTKLGAQGDIEIATMCERIGLVL
ncbi:MAG: response regulator transcription factor [Anaerolineae bacterium]|nr:response regulator transcription factor [Anaerolineae bacterium]